MVINNISLAISAFLMSKFFPIMSEIIGMHACLSFMSITCILGILFVISVMEETKGRNLDSIGCGTDHPENNNAPNSNA